MRVWGAFLAAVFMLTGCARTSDNHASAESGDLEFDLTGCGEVASAVLEHGPDTLRFVVRTRGDAARGALVLPEPAAVEQMRKGTVVWSDVRRDGDGCRIELSFGSGSGLQADDLTRAMSGLRPKSIGVARVGHPEYPVLIFEGDWPAERSKALAGIPRLRPDSNHRGIYRFALGGETAGPSLGLVFLPWPRLQPGDPRKPEVTVAIHPPSSLYEFPD